MNSCCTYCVLVPTVVCWWSWRTENLKKFPLMPVWKSWSPVTKCRIYNFCLKILLCAVLISKKCRYLLQSSLPDPSEFSTMELNSAFPVTSALPSLTCCFLSRTQPAIWLRVSVYPVSPLVVNAEKAAGWAVLKVLDRGAEEDLCDNPWKLRGEGERVFI